MTYNVFGGTLSLTQSINQKLFFSDIFFVCLSPVCVNAAHKTSFADFSFVLLQ